MSSRGTFFRVGFFLTLLVASKWLGGQEIGNTEVQILEIRSSDTVSGEGIEFILTANQFVDRIYMENSYDLQTWQTNEIFPNFDFDVEGQASFLSFPLGPTFYRATVRFPILNVFQESIQVPNGVESAQVPFGLSDVSFPFDPPDLEVISTNTTLIPEENIQVLQGLGGSIRVTPTFDGVGDVPITITATAADGVQVEATLVVTVVQGVGVAPQVADFNDAVVERRYPELDYIFSSFSPSSRFSRNGEPGNWFYQLDGEDTTKAILGFTYDESGNDADVYSEIVRLSFLTDDSGNYEYVEVVNGVSEVASGGAFDLSAFPEFGAGAAPSKAAFTRMAVGKHIVNDAWTFDSATRFNYTESGGGTPEPGNWKYEMTGETTGRVTLTYDEDANNGAVYREEVDLTFETLESGSLTYREYIAGELNNTFGGVFDFSEEP